MLFTCSIHWLCMHTVCSRTDALRDAWTFTLLAMVYWLVGRLVVCRGSRFGFSGSVRRAKCLRKYWYNTVWTRAQARAQAHTKTANVSICPNQFSVPLSAWHFVCEFGSIPANPSRAVPSHRTISGTCVNTQSLLFYVLCLLDSMLLVCCWWLPAVRLLADTLEQLLGLHTSPHTHMLSIHPQKCWWSTAVMAGYGERCLQVHLSQEDTQKAIWMHALRFYLKRLLDGFCVCVVGCSCMCVLNRNYPILLLFYYTTTDWDICGEAFSSTTRVWTEISMVNWMVLCSNWTTWILKSARIYKIWKRTRK